MSELINATIREVKEFNKSIIEKLNSQGINSKGVEQSLRIEKFDTPIQIIDYGIYYLEFLNRGRGLGKQPPLSRLIKWVRNKFGLDEKQAKKSAFGVAVKISREGTTIFKDKSKGLELSKLTDQLRQNLKMVIPNNIKVDVMEQLNEYKKRLEK